ncbi:MAG: amidohydrolase [Lentisphaeria bacterium]|nr:amidohydrolase [Lentisphaeria bacterium]
MGIIDIHTHPQWQNPIEQMTETLRLADTLDIERIVCLGGNLGFGYETTADQVRQINDLTIRLARQWPDRIVAFARLNAGLAADVVVDEIDRCVLGEGFRGIKLAVWPNARDPRVDAVMRRAAELDIPVLHHCWYKTVQKYNGESDPSDMAHLAARHPDVKIIVAHLDAAGMRGVQDIAPYPNLFIDTSGSQAFSGIVEYALEHLGAERILFGSDIPGRDFAVQLGRVMGARMTDSQREMILSRNARRLLKLS